MAWQLPPHVTLAYPEEIPSLAELTERAQAAAACAIPFRLRFGAIGCFNRPEDGLFAHVSDIDNGWRKLRDAICHGLDQVSTEPHVTIVHPRTTNRGRQAWKQLQNTTLDQEMVVHEIMVTAFDGRGWKSLHTFRLTANRPASAGHPRPGQRR